MPIKRNKHNDSDYVPPIEVAGEVSPYYRIGIYGDSKVGKTVLAASAIDVPAMSPVLVVSGGAGLNTLRGEARFSNVHLWPINTFIEMNDVFETLAPVDMGGRGYISNYATVILDELDHLHTMRLRDIMNELVAKHPDRDPEVPDRREWGKARSSLLAIIDEFSKLPAHLIVTMWAEHGTNELTGQERIMPNLAGKLAGEVPGKLDMLIYMEVNTPRKKAGQQLTEEEARGQRIAYFQPTKRFVAGMWGQSRADRLGLEMVDPTMAKIFDKLTG